MINIVLHDGLKGNLLEITRWVKQHGNWQTVEVKDMPSIKEGIFLIMDLPLIPNGAYRIENPKTEPGQVEALTIKDFMIDAINLPMIFFGSYSVVEMIGGTLTQGKGNGRIRRSKICSGPDSCKEEYSVMSRKHIEISKYPDDMFPYARYIETKEIFTQGVAAFQSNTIWCCNTIPYKFFNRKNSYYLEKFGFEIGDPLSNLLMRKAYEEQGIRV